MNARNRVRLVAALAFAVLPAVALASCKRKDKDGEEPYPSAALPPSAPPATTPADTTAAAPPPGPVPVRPTPGPGPATKPDAGAPADAGATPADAGKPDASASTADAGGGSAAKIKACVDKCQAVLQGCLTSGKDGGLPSIGNAPVCQSAFSACQAACAP